jgi:hypothetical protein
LDVIRYVVQNAGGLIDVIELLNEPAGFLDGFASVVRQFWLDGYAVVRDAVGGGLKVMIGDAFLGPEVCADKIISCLRGLIWCGIELGEFPDASGCSGCYDGLRMSCVSMFDDTFTHQTMI